MAAKKRKVDPLVKQILGEEPPAPEPRSLGGEFGELSPILGQLGTMTSDQYIKSQQELMGIQWDFFRQHYPELVEMQAAGGATARNRAMEWMGQQGPAAMRAARTANPVWAQAMDRMSAQLRNQSQRTWEGLRRNEPLLYNLNNQALQMLKEGGPTTPFTKELDRQALAELQLGGKLTPEAERYAQQSAREAFAARGQVGGDPAALAEVLNRDEMSRMRLRERQGIAAGREQAQLGRLQYGQSFAEARRGANVQQRELDQAFAMNAAQVAAASDPAWRLMGVQGAQPESMLGFTQGVRTPDPTGIMTAGLSYGSDLFNTNLNMAADIFNSYQNNAAALMGAQMQAQQVGAAAKSASGSAMGGSLIGAGGAIIGGVVAAF